MNALFAETAARLLLVGAMLTFLAGSVPLLRLDREDRVRRTAFAWAALILLMLVARATALATNHPAVTVYASRLQYTATLLQVPLSLHLIDSRSTPTGRSVFTATLVFALLPLFGPGFATDQVVRYPDALGVSIAYSVPGFLSNLLVPYSLLVGGFVVRQQRNYRGPDADLVRTVLVAVVLAVVPAGANDLLMTAFAVKSLLVVDVASSFMVLGLGYILSRRAQDAHDDLVRAIEARRVELARGAAEMRTTSRMADLGAEVASVLDRIRGPVERLVRDLVSAEDAVLAVPTGSDPRWAEEREVLAECRDAASRVKRTLDAFGELTAGEGRPPFAAPTDVRAVVDRALSIVANELRHRARLVKEVEPVPLVAADADRLVQAFVSLLVRALGAVPRAESAQGRVAIHVSATKRSVRVSISDNGAPIPATLVPLVFDPYVAAEPAISGSGLGLALCHRIVTDAGGKVTVESGASGTTVVVELPALDPAASVRPGTS